MRSWRPMSGPREAQATLLLRLSGLGVDDDLRERLDRLREVGAGVGEHDGRPLVDGDRNATVGGKLAVDRDLERALDLALRQADLRVRAVEDELDAVDRERE